MIDAEEGVLSEVMLRHGVHLPPSPDLACGAEPMGMEMQLRGVRRILRELSSEVA